MDNLTDSNINSSILGKEANNDEEEEVNDFFELIVPGVLLSIVGILGLVGNLISIFILSRPQMKGSTNCILTGLASYDSILILTSILMFGLPALAHQSEQGLFVFYVAKIFPYVTPIVYPIGLIAQSSSVYLTLCVTIERYVAVCSPLRARSICTYGRARTCVLSVGLAAFLYNIPRFLEVTWASTYDDATEENITEVRPTLLRQDPIYISVYITWMYLVVMYIVPFVSLAVLNLRIYCRIRQSTKERTKLTRNEQREIGMATMLLGVVVVFFVCNVLALVVNILELMSIAITPLTQTSNLLVTLNSSVNFIIYIIYGEKFQRIFLQMFCHTQQKNQMIHRYTIATSNGVTKSAVVEDSPSRSNPQRLQTKLAQHGWKNSASDLGRHSDFEQHYDSWNEDEGEIPLQQLRNKENVVVADHDQKQGNSDDITSGGTSSDLVPASKVSKSSSTTDLVKKVYTCQHNHHHHRHKHHHHYHHHHHNKGQCRKTKAHKSSQTKSQIYRVSKRNTKTIISAADDDDDEDPDAIQYTSRDLCVPKRDL